MPHPKIPILLAAVAMLALISGCASTKALPADAPRACKLHKIELHEDTVPIVYGYPVVPAGYLEARDASFPHAETILWGGCVVGEDKRAKVMYCDRCRSAEARFAASR